eukprot:53633_1
MDWETSLTSDHDHSNDSVSTTDDTASLNDALDDVPITVHVEICVKNQSALPNKGIVALFREYSQKLDRYYPGKLHKFPPSISKHVEYMNICMKSVKQVSIQDAHCHLHIFRNNQEGITEEIDDETSCDQVHVANTYSLPNHALDGLFDSLIFKDDIKHRLLNYMETISKYAKAGINKDLIAWNGVILLHGPPGTGKTSLCKALAQKLSIRLANEFAHCSLIEINSHSLFSKWFSESGKLVQKLFKSIMEQIEYEDSLVFVLIDEVESLAAARQSALNGSEPSDSIRAVNALLTQLDQLRSYSNVLVLATSNISQSIDLAFIDRADLKQYIGNPMEKARYCILQSCIEELLEKKLVVIKAESNGKDRKKDENTRENHYLSCYDEAKALDQQVISPIPFPKFVPNKRTHGQKCSQKLMQIVRSLHGFSGRSLRKLPFLTAVHFIESETSSLTHFLKCLQSTVRIEKDQRNKLKK